MQNKSGNTYVLHAKFQNVLFQMAFHEQTLMMRPTWRCRCRIGCKESTLIRIYQKENDVTLYFILIIQDECSFRGQIIFI